MTDRVEYSAWLAGRGFRFKEYASSFDLSYELNEVGVLPGCCIGGFLTTCVQYMDPCCLLIERNLDNPL